MRYVNLHGHSTYSFLDGYGKPIQIAERIKNLGQTAAALTDHGNIFGHVNWQKSFISLGLKPIFGCEFYIVSDINIRDKVDPILDITGFPHITVIAINQKGYRNLLRLVTIAQTEGFYRKPRIDWNILAKYQDGLAVLSGCVGSHVNRLINNNKYNEANKFILERVSQIENFFIELVPEPGLDISHSSLPILVQIARENKLKMVMTSDAHFPEPSQFEVQDITFAIGMNKRIGEERICGMNYQYYCSPEELLDRMKRTLTEEMWNESEMISAIETSAMIADMCEVEIPKSKPISFWNKNGENENDILLRMINDGLQKRLEQGKIPKERLQEYKDRADREYEIISRKEFADYILCLTDIARWVKSNNSLVMCRGSAGGCLILWLLECSETDSIANELSFERFYDDTRPDPPDIDMDFEIGMREKVIEYIYEKYGKENCSQIAAITLLRARNALMDLADYYNIPRSEYAPLSALLDSKDDDVESQLQALKDVSALGVIKKYPELKMAEQMVGQCKNQTVHAAGLLISAEPLVNIIATGTFGKEHTVSSVDKHDAAYLNFLKLDLLAVAAFDVIGKIVRKIGKTVDWLYSLTYDDPKVYELAKSGKVAGVFQLDGAALQVGYKINLDTFQELYACSALCRPGAMQFVDLYRENKFNETSFNNFLRSMSPIAADIIRNTYGVLLYQEQVMRMCREMAGMDWGMVHKLRKRIAAASFNGHALGLEYSDPFIHGCIQNGISAKEAEFWWDAIKAHGIYSFNKSHCVTYAIVGYWMLYLKLYYPDEYFEIYLSQEGNSNSTDNLLTKRLIREYIDSGGEMVLLDYKESKEGFHSPKKGKIVGGWSNIKGIGSATAQKLEKLSESGAFKSWFDVEQYLPKKIWEQLSDIGIIEDKNVHPRYTSELAPWMPIHHTDTKDKMVRDHYRLKRPGELGNEEISGDTFVGGYLTVKQKKARTGQFKGEQIIYMLEDETGQVTMRVPQKDLNTIGQKCKDEMNLGNYLVVKGWYAGSVLFIKDFTKVS